MTNSFWVPKFRLSPDRKEKIAELIGYEHVECIESACGLYLGFKTTPQPTAKRVRQRRLWEIKEALGKLDKALEKASSVKGVHDDARLLLQGAWAESKLPWYIFDEAFDILNIFFKAFKEVNEPPERGAVTGEKQNPPGRFFAWQLYQCCIKAGITPTRINNGKENSILHKIMKILRRPLNIPPNEMDGILNEVIVYGKKHYKEFTTN